MDCDEARTLISADLDGQLEDHAGLDTHLAECAACRDWRNQATALAHSIRPPTVMRGNETLPHGFLAYRWVRFALGWAGILLVVWNVGGVFETVDDTIQHLWRHQHAFGVALGLTFLFVAWRPDRAYGLVPVAATFTVALGGATIVDLIGGTTPLSREARHLVEILGLGLLWVLGWNAGPGRTPRQWDTDDVDVSAP